MKKSILIIGIIFLSSFVKAQNLPACDSLVINCCTFDSLGPNTFTIYASNYSSNLFDYPGFVLFNTAMDTIAKETVNYFGIGQGPQPHTLTIVAPLILPFNGYLNLYTLFYDSFACSFPFSIADTANSIHAIAGNEGLKIYPNPAINEATVEFDNFSFINNLSLSVFDMLGKEIYWMRFDQSSKQLSLKEMDPGIYLLRITDEENRLQGSRKLMVQGKEKF